MVCQLWKSAELILPQLQKVYARTIKSNTGADQEVIDLLWRKLTACVAILGRVANHLDGEVISFLPTSAFRRSET